MTATEELCRMLDAVGVEYEQNAWSSGAAIWWRSRDGITWRAHDNDEDELLSLYAWSSVTPEQAVEATLGHEVTGETSDGYHTMAELYHHRAVLFSVIVRDHRELAWKSKAHHDGTMYDGMFIVGIETPEGQATYHYDIDPYWNMFDCKELDRAPEWDGHTPDEAIERIAMLGRGTCHTVAMDCFGNPPYNQSGLNGNSTACGCSECGVPWSTMGVFRGNLFKHNFKACPICGCKVVGK